jgi:hypothetical protein
VCETCNFSRHQQLLANLLYIHQQILTTSQTITLIPEPYTASESFPSLFLPRAVPKNNHKPVSDMNSPSAHPPSPPLLLPLRPVNSTTPPGSSPTLHISHEAVQGRLLYACELCELEITPYLCANCVQPIHARTQLNLPAATAYRTCPVVPCAPGSPTPRAQAPLLLQYLCIQACALVLAMFLWSRLAGIRLLG